MRLRYLITIPLLFSLIFAKDKVFKYYHNQSPITVDDITIDLKKVLKGVSAKKLVIALDMEGFEVSSGSACSSGKVSDSHVLVAMGLDKSIVEGALRISLCEPLSKKNISHFSDVLCKIVYRFKNYDIR